MRLIKYNRKVIIAVQEVYWMPITNGKIIIKDDEYGHIYEYEHEIAFFNNKEDAEEYKEDFESNYRRLGNYTYYSSKIITVNDKMIY